MTKGPRRAAEAVLFRKLNADRTMMKTADNFLMMTQFSRFALNDRFSKTCLEKLCTNVI